MNPGRLCLLTPVCALLISFLTGTAAAATGQQPNLVFIMADDLGYGDLSCFGQQKFTTPNLDRMCEKGMKFTQHYSGSTVCAPSRCVLMTGLHTGHSFIRTNHEIKPEGQYPIPADTVTVAKLLKDAGYATGLFGKWGLGGPGTEGEPLKQGFDEFFGYNCQRLAHNYYPKYLWHNNERVPLDGQTYAHDLIVDQALDFIRKNKSRPFFCYMPVTIPHASMHVPEEDAAPFRKKFARFEDKIGKYSGPEVKNPIAAFAGMVTRLDRNVGQVLDLLKELGLDRHTLVIFTSDNGAHQEGGHDPVFFNSCGPLRGIKRSLHDGGIRVPTIACWPGRVPAGTVNDHLSGFQDWLPTSCDLAGIDTPAGLDGLSMLPGLTGQDTQQKQHPYLYWEFRGQRAVRMGTWKAVQSQQELMLFNIEEDLGESMNIAAQNPKVVAQIEKIMTEAHEESPLE